MKIISSRGDFKCAVLEKKSKTDLTLLFEAKKSFYNDPKNMIADQNNRQEILNCIESEGEAFYEYAFYDPQGTEFILLENNKVIGSCALLEDKEKHTIDFCGGHVSSEFYGLHLSDLLYEARENYCKKLEYDKALTAIGPLNFASRKAAERNGFKAVDSKTSPSIGRYILYEKNIG